MRNLRKKSLVALLIVAATLIALFCAPAYAADGYKTVTAQLSPHYTIVVDGVAREFYNVNGQEVQPISYQGTTYLPLRAIGELMDKNVDWNQSTKTATLSGSRNGSVTKGVSDPNAQKQNVTATLRYDFTIIVDGVEQTFRDVNGNTVYPLLYNGSTYLPIRAIGNLMGKTVSWDSATYTATLSGGEDSLVTDADTFGQSGTQTTTQTGTQTSGDIGEAKAKEIALNHAGISASQATFAYVKKDYDNGRWEYEVEFYSGNTEYDYDIDAATGAILSFDYEAEHYTPATSTQTGSDIGEAKAKEIALNHAGISASQATFAYVKKDYDNGRWEYEVEFYSGSTEYDYEIDAASGTILSFDHDAEYYTAPSTSQSSSRIGEAKAKEIALNRAGLSASQVNYIKCELDYDDGRWKYDVEFRSGGYEYDLEIDASSGTVLSYDKEWD